MINQKLIKEIEELTTSELAELGEIISKKLKNKVVAIIELINSQKENRSGVGITKNR